MKATRFLIMLRKDFDYRISQRVANGRGIYAGGDWVGYLSYDSLGNPKGFVIGARGAHLKAMCVIHEQRLIE